MVCKVCGSPMVKRKDDKGAFYFVCPTCGSTTEPNATEKVKSIVTVKPRL